MVLSTFLPTGSEENVRTFQDFCGIINILGTDTCSPNKQSKPKWQNSALGLSPDFLLLLVIMILSF